MIVKGKTPSIFQTLPGSPPTPREKTPNWPPRGAFRGLLATTVGGVIWIMGGVILDQEWGLLDRAAWRPMEDAL